MTRTCCLYPSPKYIVVRARATNFVVTFVLLTDNARVKIVSKILRERERERERVNYVWMSLGLSHQMKKLQIYNGILVGRPLQRNHRRLIHCFFLEIF